MSTKPIQMRLDQRFITYATPPSTAIATSQPADPLESAPSLWNTYAAKSRTGRVVKIN